MNQCIISIVGKTVSVTFKQIVREGSIEIKCLNGLQKPEFNKVFVNTNFESLNLKNQTGSYQIKVKMDGEHIIKTIHIK